MVDNTIAFKKWIPGIAWFFIISVLVFLPGNEVPKVNWMDQTHLDKLAHAFLFFVLIRLLFYPVLKAPYSFQKKKNFLIRLCLSAIVWGICIEFIQKYFISGRGFELLDWAADSLGVLMGYWISKRKLLVSKKQELSVT